MRGLLGLRYFKVILSLTLISNVSSLLHGTGTLLSKSRVMCEMSSIADFRKEYSKQGLNEGDTPADDPYDLFKKWFNEACNAKVLEPNAMCLSTCKDNIPSARIVLLKAYDERGFVWYTNYESRKAVELLSNPHGALTFWWGDLERSVRIEGTVERVSEEESDQYFQSRPRDSQIGAWSSDQSRPIGSRDDLLQQEDAIRLRFEDKAASRPPHWGGFRLRPLRIEFWKGREGRLHDRLSYSVQSDGSWSRQRLQP